MLQGMSIEKRLVFIQSELRWWTDYVKKELRVSIQKEELIDTRELLRSLSKEVVMRTNLQSGVAKIIFNDSGRFADQGSGRGYLKGLPLTTNRNAVKKGITKRAPIKWYAKNAYGTLNRLMYNFATKYSDAIVEGTKDVLENKLKNRNQHVN
jgi:hypothetical protein